MTTPFERTRAFAETGHFLEQLSTGRIRPTSLEALQVTAEALLRHARDETSLRNTPQLVPFLRAEPGAPRDYCV